MEKWFQVWEGENSYDDLIEFGISKVCKIVWNSVVESLDRNPLDESGGGLKLEEAVSIFDLGSVGLSSLFLVGHT